MNVKSHLIIQRFYHTYGSRLRAAGLSHSGVLGLLLLPLLHLLSFFPLNLQ